MISVPGVPLIGEAVSERVMPPVGAVFVTSTRVFSPAAIATLWFGAYVGAPNPAGTRSCTVHVDPAGMPSCVACPLVGTTIV